MADTPSSLPRRLKSDGSARSRTLSDAVAGRIRSAPTGAARVAVKKLFAAEETSFFVILGTALFLVVFGLVMVLSSSSVEQYVATHDFFGAFLRQGIFAALGVPAMLVVSRVPTWAWKKYAWHLLVLAMFLQLLVFTPLGSTVNGNRNWIRIGSSFSAQPSEFLKLALVIWIGMILVKKERKLGDWKELLVPLIPVVLIAMGLVMKGGDLGTTLILIMLVAVAVFVAGVKLRFFVPPLILLACVLPVITSGASSRTDRISAWMSGCSSEEAYQSTCWQTVHGLWALASGGVFGVGLGNSKAKWSWLPEADNDFIFAIVGEELGLIGACVVLALFIVLAVSFMKILRSTDDPFVRIVTGGVMTWVIGQALVNIAVVLGLLPVLGVPLPLISAGGSSLIFTLIAIGVVLSFVHRRPGDPVSALRSDEQVGSLR
ncbi:cell division-specific peptidoglycan biosynthesis regulator FtsW [Frondihabitans sp. PhB188]|uniref:putative lipid II flippase FtsW n=1 Tax=Frondihabitans sp. PhB188 TaxID=2485200 RepID=UPI000F48352D|nr:putative lipid II flippase FtsW [Frondihabitans sp. PhB188]ROQ40854.1 cell division-specific peptidoglycan biosynthesis regulator FtsW [Frondihabitans sp. PhB188]